MDNLTFAQRQFFNALTLGKYFKSKVIERGNKMGVDGAFYFGIGEMQSMTENYSFDELDDDGQENFISAVIEKLPELEF